MIYDLKVLYILEENHRIQELQEQMLQLHEIIIAQQRSLKDFHDQAMGDSPLNLKLKEMIEERNNLINALYRSTSWKITSPLRAISEVIRSISTRIK